MRNIVGKTGVLFLTAVTLSGCAGGLNVKVDVLDKTYLESLINQDTYRKEAMMLANGNFSQSAQFVAETRQALLYAGNEGCLRATEEFVAKQLQAGSTVRTITMDAITSARKRVIPLTAKTEADLAYMGRQLNMQDNYLEKQLNQHYGRFFWDTNSDTIMPTGMMRLLARRRATLGAAKMHRTAMLDESAGLCVEKVEKRRGIAGLDEENYNSLVKNLTVQLDTEIQLTGERLDKTILGGGALIHDQEGAFHVVNADERHWATDYNKAFGQGVFGSTSTAIKINGLADYTVKGFSFDGRSTANMMRKLAGTTVGFAAAMYGVPIDMKSDNANPSSVAFEGTGLSGAQSAIDINHANTKQYQASIKRVARTILTYQDDLDNKNGAKAKERADNYVKAAYEGNIKSVAPQ